MKLYNYYKIKIKKKLSIKIFNKFKKYLLLKKTLYFYLNLCYFSEPVNFGKDVESKK